MFQGTHTTISATTVMLFCDCVAIFKASFGRLFRTNLWELNFSRTKIFQDQILELILYLYYLWGLGVLDFLNLIIFTNGGISSEL